MSASQQQLTSAYQAYEQGDSEKALSVARQILEHDPDHAEGYQIASMSQANLGDMTSALVLQRRAIQLNPSNPLFHYNIAVLYQQTDQDTLAMLSYHACLRVDPDHADALWNYGEMLRLNEFFDEAIVCFERLLEMGKAYSGLQHRLAVTYNGIGRYRAAARCFEQSMSHPDGNGDLTQWEYSHLLLGEGELQSGWQYYESRYRIKGDGCIRVHPFEYPRWMGEPLKDRTLLIHGEQGIGDEIMFASIIPALIREGRKIIIACHPSLCRLFTYSFPEAYVLPHLAVGQTAEVADLEPIDYELPICSLAHRRGPYSVNEHPEQNYLKATSDRVEYFNNKINQLTINRRKTIRVGLMWSANPATGSDWGQRRSKQKSITVDDLAAFKVAAKKIQFVSLQNRDSGKQAAFLPSLDIIDLHDELLDFADTIALAACLDLIITVDTSVAHMAGGLGKPVWVLLKQHPDWRWLNQGNGSYWYHSARLFRQTKKGCWHSVLEEVYAALKNEFSI